MSADQLHTEPAKTHLAGGDHYRYPGAGDELPPSGASVTLLTKGGVAVRGVWLPGGAYLGWAPLPRRDKDKEKQLMT